MGNPRSFTTTFNAKNRELEGFRKSRGCTSTKKIKAAVARAASGRPADLASQARISLALRRIAGSAQV
jgi:hypothetical protein